MTSRLAHCTQDHLPGLFSWGVPLVGGDDVLEDLLWESVVFCCPVTFKFIIYLYISSINVINFFFYSKTVLVSIIMCGAVWGFLLISTFSTRKCWRMVINKRRGHRRKKKEREANNHVNTNSTVPGAGGVVPVDSKEQRCFIWKTNCFSCLMCF